MGYDAHITRAESWLDAEQDPISLEAWVAHVRSDPGNHAWFDLQNGCIVVKNPDTEILHKMLRVAARFDAHVHGEDGEDYGADGDAAAKDADTPWWRRLLGR